MEIILATRNVSKAEQIKNIFSDDRFIIKTLFEAGIEGDAIEDGHTLVQNATKKARFAYEQGGGHRWTMADDSGIFIDALDGEPGIKSARWAGENATTEEIMNYCLQQLDGENNRSATFRTSVAIIRPSGQRHFFSGEIRGHILEYPLVKFQPGMPYSGIFVPDGGNRVWAQMTVEEENKISHRGQAFRSAKSFLEKYL